MCQRNIFEGNIITLEETDSTNKFAEKLIEADKAIEGNIIITKTQTNGKGYATNRWISEANKNLTFSIILKPSFVPPEKQFVLHKITALSILETLSNYIADSKSLKIKWPNDIYYKKFKIAGVLTENKIAGNKISNSIIGIGININQKEFPKELPNPISLIQITNEQTSNEGFLKNFYKTLHSKYQAIKQNVDIFDEDYLNNLFQKGEYNKYFANNKQFGGTIIGIDEYGFLEIEDNSNKVSSFDFKEIKYSFEK